VITTEGGWIANAALPFEQSFEVYFEGATLLFNSSQCPLTVLSGKGKKQVAKLSKEDGFLAELKAVVEPLAKGEVGNELLGKTARTSLALVLAEQNSAKTGKQVAFKGK
jgi:hypothetical protein